MAATFTVACFDILICTCMPTALTTPILPIHHTAGVQHPKQQQHSSVHARASRLVAGALPNIVLGDMPKEHPKQMLPLDHHATAEHESVHRVLLDLLVSRNPLVHSWCPTVTRCYGQHSLVPDTPTLTVSCPTLCSAAAAKPSSKPETASRALAWQCTPGTTVTLDAPRWALPWVQVAPPPPSACAILYKAQPLHRAALADQV